MGYIYDVNNGQKPSTKKYVLIAVILVSIAIASMFFANTGFDARGHFTGPLVQDGLKINAGWNLVSIPYSDVSIDDEVCQISKIYYYNSSGYKKLDSLSDLKSGFGYWIYSNAECSLKFSELTEMINNGGDSPVTGYDTNVYRGKVFTKDILGKYVPNGTIKQICVYGNAASDATLTIRINESSPDLYDVKVYTASGWKCTDTNIQWNYSTLFIYKKSGSAAISYSLSQPYDSRYSYDSGNTWSKDSWRRGIKFNVTKTNDAKISDFPELKKGWNLIGSLSENIELNKIIGNCEVKKMYSYDPEKNKFSFSRNLESGKAYWINVKNDCKLADSAKADSGSTDSGGSTIIDTSKDYVVLGISPNVNEAESKEVVVYTTNGWSCTDTSIVWSSNKLFIYKKSGPGIITASPTLPYDSYYSDNNGAKWAKDPGSKRRGIKVYIKTSDGEKEISNGGDTSVNEYDTTNYRGKLFSLEVNGVDVPSGTITKVCVNSKTTISSSTTSNTIVLIVNDKNSLNELETDFQNGLKSDGVSFDILQYSEANYDKLSKYKTIFILEYNQKLTSDTLFKLYNAGAEIKLIADASKYSNDISFKDPFIPISSLTNEGKFQNSMTGASVSIERRDSYSSHQEYSYEEKTPAISKDNHDISSDIDKLASGDLGGGFTPVGLIRDYSGTLYMAYNYPIFKQYKGVYKGHDWVNDEDETPYSGYTLTFGVGVAKSDDDGKTWSFISKSNDVHEVKGPRFDEKTYFSEDSFKACETRKEDIRQGIAAREAKIAELSSNYDYWKNLIEEYKKENVAQEKSLSEIECQKSSTSYKYFYENDLSEVDFHGIAPSPDGGIDVYYSWLYRNRRAYIGGRISNINSRMYDIFKQLNQQATINVPALFTSYKPYEDLENIYELHKIHIKDGEKLGDEIISDSDKPTDYIDTNMAFIGEDNGRQFFVKDTNLYYSDDGGKTLQENGYKGIFKDGVDMNDDDSKLKNIIQMQELLYWNYGNDDGYIIGYYNGGLYKSDGENFNFIRYVGTEEQRKKMSNFARQTSYPLMKFDGDGNLHIIIMDKHTQYSDLFGWHTSPGLEADLYYQFIPAKEFDSSKDPQIKTVYFFRPSGCTIKCDDFVTFLKDGGINAIENPSGDEFKSFTDSKQIVTVVKKDGGYNTIYGLNKIKVAKYLGIEIKPMKIDTYSPILRTPGKRAESPSDEIFPAGNFYFTDNDMPGIVYEESDGVYQYYYSLDGWNKQKIISLNINDYPVRSSDNIMMEPYVLLGHNINEDGKIDFLVFKSKKASGIKYDDENSPVCHVDGKDRICDKYGDWNNNYNTFSKMLIFTDKTDYKNPIVHKLFLNTYYNAKSYFVPVPNIMIWTNKIMSSVGVSGYEQPHIEYPYYINYYDSYTAEEYSPPTSSAIATQLIPGAVMYLPLDNQQVQGNVVGQLADYVTEEGIVEEDGEKYYRVKVDFSKKIKAKDSHIAEKTIKGFVKLDSGYATLTLNVIDKPLATESLVFGEDDLSVQAVKNKKLWIVANNLAVPNIVCGQEIDANSYKIINPSSQTDNCLKTIEVGYEYIGYCDDWERVHNKISKRIMTAYSNSLKLVVDNTKSNYENFFGNSDAKVYMGFYVDDWVDLEKRKEVDDAIKSGSCNIPTVAKDFALVEFKGSLFSDQLGTPADFVENIVAV